MSKPHVQARTEGLSGLRPWGSDAAEGQIRSVLRLFAVLVRASLQPCRESPLDGDCASSLIAGVVPDRNFQSLRTIQRHP